jgi:hypothetical protein
LTFGVTTGQGARADHPGLYPVRAANGNWGFIDATGAYVIAPTYEGAGEFSDGVAYVYQWSGDRRINGIVNARGVFTAIPTNDYGVEFHEGLARIQGAVEGDRAFGFVDKAGRVVIAPRFWDAGPFSEGLAWVAEWHDRKLLYGFIDRAGRYAIPPRFTLEPRDFSEGFAWVQTEREYTLIDRAGREVFAGKFEWVDYNFSEGLLAVIIKGEQPRGIYVDRTGREVFAIPAWNERTAKQRADAQMSWLQLNAPFAEGLAPFRSFNKIGFIDRTGKVVIPAQFRGTKGFANGRAAVMVIGPAGEYVWGYIDHTGEMVIQPNFREAGLFKGTLARVTTIDGVEQLIDRTGRAVWRSQ